MADTIKPKDLDPGFIKDIEATYGPVNMDKDFFSSDLDTYYKVDSEDKETNTLSHKVIHIASFTDTFKDFVVTLKSLKKLIQTPVGKLDNKLPDIFGKAKVVFNDFRTHIRTKYPNQYSQIKSSVSEMSMTGGGASFSTGEGEQYATPRAFKPKKDSLKENNIYKYKLTEKIKSTPRVKEFQNDRIGGFDKIQDLIVQLGPLLKSSKEETINFYKENPDSYTVVSPTDLIEDYLMDIIKMLKDE